MINTIFTFAFGKEVNFGEPINFIESDIFLNFKKDVVGYGYALRGGIDANFDKKSTIKLRLYSDYILNGNIEFKSEISGERPEKEKSIRISVGQNNIELNIPSLSSKLKEIVIFFPKKSNNSTKNDYIPFIRFESIIIE